MMAKKWEEALVEADTSIEKVMGIIADASLQAAIVVDEKNKLLGMVTDGDIRRGILGGVGLEEPVERVMNKEPTTVLSGADEQIILSVMKNKKIHQVPVVDEEKRVIGLEILDEILSESQYDNWVVLMAGGLGSRLRPLTDDIPKPMIEIQGKPILETILESFVEAGFHRFYITLNYMADKIRDYFGDGSRWGVEIRYYEEDKKLGTAGSLAHLDFSPRKPIIVMNSDLITGVNFKHLLNFHAQQKATATMCVRNYEFQIPYGVVETENYQMKRITEKPEKTYFVNAGIYIFQPEVLRFIPENEHIDMTAIYEKLLKNEKDVAVFPVTEYWQDVGRKEDLQRVRNESLDS
jgi:dTDP-glucose pyrophosphorylase